MVTNERGLRVDRVELRLEDAALAGEPWAVIYYLNTQARDRGYGKVPTSPEPGSRCIVERLPAKQGCRLCRKFHIPPNLVVKGITAHRKPPDMRICRLRNQSRVGTVPPSTSTPHWPACCARR